ncbi:response regulator transcription factor, partial [Salmonella enterica]|nr:response regulator transcription factor [Salmonella enterica]EBA9124639.1 response regulator transcription factor [Salmonella enterica]
QIRKHINNLAEISSLTPSEKQVLIDLAKGESVQAVANRTGKSIKTISTQKRMAYKKIGVNNDILFIYLLFGI